MVIYYSTYILVLSSAKLSQFILIWKILHFLIDLIELTNIKMNYLIELVNTKRMSWLICILPFSDLKIRLNYLNWFEWFTSGVSNLWPAGHLWPERSLRVARQVTKDSLVMLDWFFLISAIYFGNFTWWLYRLIMETTLHCFTLLCIVQSIFIP